MKKYRKVILGVVSLGAVLSLMTGCSDGRFAKAGENGMLGSSEQGYAYGSSDGTPAFMGKDGKLSSGEQAVQDVFYFAFDRSKLDDNAVKQLRQHARYLLKNQNVKVRVEGHTDERGSREYNVALGERRAKSVAQQLLNEGVRSNQVAVVSYGEEKPAVQGHDESSWQWNRRGKVAYELG